MDAKYEHVPDFTKSCSMWDSSDSTSAVSELRLVGGWKLSCKLVSWVGVGTGGAAGPAAPISI